jgi:chaperonin cofactor prefoldin
VGGAFIVTKGKEGNMRKELERCFKNLMVAKHENERYKEVDKALNKLEKEIKTLTKQRNRKK